MAAEAATVRAAVVGGDISVSFGTGVVAPYGAVMFATGRVPNTSGLGLEAVGVELGDKGQIVVDALRAFDRQRYRLDQWVVMPNHVHALVTPHEGYRLKRILQGWKSFTAHAINSHLGRHGQLWQRESFDHLVRSADHLERFRRYIRANPPKAGTYAARCRLAPS